MNKINILLLPVLSLFVSGCASVMSGTDQDIAVHTNPEGAECVLTREGQLLRKVETPQTVRVSKLKHDIYVTCNKDGFHESTAHVNSGIQGSVFGNILLGGGIGWAVDSARGADNKYADVVTVTMVPMAQAAPETVKVDPNGKVTVLDAEDVAEEAIEETASEENRENDVEPVTEEGIDENIEETVEEPAKEMEAETPAEMEAPAENGGQADIQ